MLGLALPSAPPAGRRPQSHGVTPLTECHLRLKAKGAHSRYYEPAKVLSIARVLIFPPCRAAPRRSVPACCTQDRLERTPSLCPNNLQDEAILRHQVRDVLLSDERLGDRFPGMPPPYTTLALGTWASHAGRSPALCAGVRLCQWDRPCCPARAAPKREMLRGGGARFLPCRPVLA